MQITYKPIAVSEAAAVHAIEAASYPADEAASLAQIKMRLNVAGAYFLGGYEASHGHLVGFVNGTLAPRRELEDETMSRHDPNGRYLCIHSVVMDAAYRRQGLASAMLKAYVDRIVADQPHVEAILLLCKPYLVQFYVQAGFQVTRLSPVVHGKDAWLECVLDCVSARQLKIIQVDAFTSVHYEGNPAAIVPMTAKQFDAATDAWMQVVAQENNLSETAYVAPTSNPSTYRLRWFTPAMEVNLCGHGTLATAKVLFEDGYVSKSSTLDFETRGGRLTTRYLPNGEIQMAFPLCAPAPLADGSNDLKLDILASLQLNDADVVAWAMYGKKILCHVNPDRFATLGPVDFTRLGALDAQGLMVTTKGGDASGVDYVNRYFDPRAGVNEDPVTGSAHCVLAPYWAAILSKSSLVARQVSHRPGTLRLQVDTDQDRVILHGDAVITMRGVVV
ncbi:hypothetical protein H310_08742 [Aphanomyces invadans]|uniref:N-acetyltransferase domain-containing protein n=1 Tax=Aphanomyces invadans TaxID=157072 RepID=A0A024TYB1_9STRA|nr:hypothetical protein H310_08742 [Aphanomyces invadans]ETV98626.1 hypothetical protein H310_08742 [Aphanomyces invadans]|eukprot:XP_008872823.1 hypothetical protein H310_08742 [Aphanomyces invadans]